MRRLLDGDKALALQAFEDSKRRRQELAALTEIFAAARNCSLDASDQQLGDC